MFTGDAKAMIQIIIKYIPLLSVVQNIRCFKQYIFIYFIQDCGKLLNLLHVIEILQICTR